jgi:hypothetical protein
MIENKESLEKCDVCFSPVTYLLGYCPACNDSGFVKKQAKEPLPLEENNYVDKLRKFPNPGNAIR